MSSIADLLGSLFIPAAVIWLSATVSLTVVIVVGAVSLVKSRTLKGYWIVSWIGAFVILYNVKNLGWTGAFMTRQISPLFPVICFSFGIGAELLDDKIRNLSWETTRIESSVTVTSSVLVAIFLGACLLGLLAIGGVHGSFTAADSQVTETEVSQLQETVGDKTDLAVVGSYTHYRTVLYTHGELRPDVLLENESDLNDLYFTEIDNLHYIDSPSSDNISKEYIFIIRKCGGYSDREKEYIERLSVVYENHTRSSGCDTHAILLRNT